MVRWVVRSILHGVDPLSYFSFQPVLHDWFEWMNEWMNEWMFNDTPARKTDRLLGVRERWMHEMVNYIILGLKQKPQNLYFRYPRIKHNDMRTDNERRASLLKEHRGYVYIKTDSIGRNPNLITFKPFKSSKVNIKMIHKTTTNPIG